MYLLYKKNLNGKTIVMNGDRWQDQEAGQRVTVTYGNGTKS